MLYISADDEAIRKLAIDFEDEAQNLWTVKAFVKRVATWISTDAIPSAFANFKPYGGARQWPENKLWYGGARVNGTLAKSFVVKTKSAYGGIETISIDSDHVGAYLFHYGGNVDAVNTEYMHWPMGEKFEPRGKWENWDVEVWPGGRRKFRPYDGPGKKFHIMSRSGRDFGFIVRRVGRGKAARYSLVGFLAKKFHQAARPVFELNSTVIDKIHAIWNETLADGPFTSRSRRGKVGK